MTYSITGITESPDVGFKFGSRQTAQDARELAIAYIAAGLLEVEVRDASGNVRSLRNLSAMTTEHGPREAAIAQRLAAL